MSVLKKIFKTKKSVIITSVVGVFLIAALSLVVMPDSILAKLGLAPQTEEVPQTVGVSEVICQKTEVDVLVVLPAWGDGYQENDDTAKSDLGILTATELKSYLPGVETFRLHYMTTNQLTANLNDLNAGYDMIYISAGYNGDYMNRNNSDSSEHTTVYNNGALNGLVYRSTGDNFGLDTNYQYTGNDISTGIQTGLTDYVGSGAPVVVADELLLVNDEGSITSVNANRVEATSNLYGFLNSCYVSENVFSHSQMLSANAHFQETMNVSGLSLSFYLDGQLCADSYDGSELSLFHTEENYRNVIQLEFAAFPQVNAEQAIAYHPDFIVDVDKDGRFDENVAEVTFYFLNENGKWEIKTDDTFYSGQRYRLDFGFSKTYVGNIAWKLQLRDASNDKVKTEKVAYQTISKSVNTAAEQRTVKVLQIKSNQGTTIDMGDLANDKTAKQIRKLLTDKMNVTGMTFEFTSMTLSDFESTYGTDAGYEQLCASCDMIMIGFSENYGAISSTALDVLSRFQENPTKSLLTSNDVAAFGQTNGFSNGYLDANTTGSYYKSLTETSGVGSSANGVYDSMVANVVNDGQISCYPYAVGDNVRLSSTHYQDYALNLNSNVSVWYAIGTDSDANTQYSASPRDAINNYYIYSCGNVMYTGVGSTNMLDANGYVVDGEAKLFANTIVATAQLAMQMPSISVRKSASLNAAKMEYYVLPYDIMVNSSEYTALESEVEFALIIANPNLTTSPMQVSYEYFINDKAIDTTGVAYNTELVYSDNSSIAIYKVSLDTKDIVKCFDDDNHAIIKVRVTYSYTDNNEIKTFVTDRDIRVSKALLNNMD